MLFNYLFIFMIGSIGGYILELLYRRIMLGKWIKPGVFYGLYLPLYGLGLCICYFFYNLDIHLFFKIVFTVILLSLIELICGLIFIKYFKIPLWDYSRNKFNYRGLICFKYSVYWGLLGIICIMFVFPFIDFEFFFIREIVLFMYFFYVFLVVDVLYKLFYLFYSKMIKQS